METSNTGRPEILHLSSGELLETGTFKIIGFAILSEMPRLKNCWACHISSWSRTFKGGGGTTHAEGANFLGGLEAYSPRNF